MGSSPHTRGALVLPRRHPPYQRIIPAYAGSTGGYGRALDCEWDHPRIRGEHGASSPLACLKSGSSPHTRGALNAVAILDEASRIIPAYAGSTPPVGEPHENAGGSSPHTRGAPAPTGVPESEMRIIPAYAGSTVCPAASSVKAGDHPRIRGEHPSAPSKTLESSGSSPHTRGALGAGGAPAGVAGIIPAYAGSTRHPTLSCRTQPDHPRIRGEHRLSGLYTGDGQGSSPHTRGAPAPPIIRVAEGGIIPAYAGSTNLCRQVQRQ